MAAATTRPGDQNLRVLVVSADPQLAEEFRSAFERIPDRTFTLFTAESERDAADAARRRQPHLSFIEVGQDAAATTALTRDLLTQVPDSMVVGVFAPEWLQEGATESATIIQLMRSHVRDFVRRPISATELRTVIDRLFSRAPEVSAPQEGRVIAFVSSKGGAGKSTLAVNVAVGLAQRFPDEVLLIDASLQIGTCAMQLDLKPTTSIIDVVRERERLDKTLLRHLTLNHPSGLRLLAAPPDPLEAAEVDEEAVLRIVNMACRSFKYVVIDTFPVIDGVLMTILDVADLAYVVVPGTAPAVAGAVRLLPILEGLGVASHRQRLILNYNYAPFAGDLKPVDIADRLQRTIDYVVPYDARVLVSGNTGSPQILHARRWHKLGRVLTDIVDDLAGPNEAESATRGAAGA